MTDTIWQTIAATPWWIYLFSAYLLWVSMMATKPRLISIKNLSIMPFFFTALSVMCLCAMSHTVTFIHLSIWLGTLFLGTGLGYLQLLMFDIKAVQHTDSLYMPGTWLAIVMLAMIAIAKCYFGFQFYIDPLFFIDPQHSILLVFSYGLLTGLFVGRLAYALRCLKTGPFRSQDSIALT